MSLPYGTAKAGDRALMELQKTLAKFGCSAFGTMVDNDNGVTIVHFRWRNRTVNLEASWKGYATAWLKQNPYRHRYRGPTREQHQQKALDQAKVSVASVLRDWGKAQITAVECGVMSFECAFAPHMLLPDGTRIIDKINAALPPMIEDNSNVVDLPTRA